MDAEFFVAMGKECTGSGTIFSSAMILDTENSCWYLYGWLCPLRATLMITYSFTPISPGSSMKYFCFCLSLLVSLQVLSSGVACSAAQKSGQEVNPAEKNRQSSVGQPAQDDVLATIEQAVKQYKAGDLAGAASNMDYAAQLIRQKKSEKMKSLLPEPLAGWQAREANAQAMGTAVFGGGVTVSRKYTRGPATVEVEIVSDSPVLQSVMMMLNNPMFAGAGGGTLETIKGQRAIVKYNKGNHSGDVNIVVAGRFMVTVKGRNVQRQDLIGYAGAVDYQGLSKY